MSSINKELSVLQPLKSFLPEYEIVYQKFTGHSHPTTILLGETHTSAEHRTLNGRLITHIASIFPKTFVLLEGLPSGERIVDTDEKRSISRTFFIEERVFNKIEFQGWDGSNDVLNRCGYPTYLLQEMRNNRKSLREQLKQLYQNIKTLRSHFIATEERMMNMSDDEFNTLEELLETSLTQAGLLKMELQNKIKLIDSIFAKGPATDDRIRETFQARTDAMVNTLTAIENMRRDGQMIGPTILIAGEYHLRTPVELATTPQYNLDPLYRQLEIQSSSIVLIPKTPQIPIQVEDSKQ